jgi:homoserine dehydrogenase
MRRGRLIVLKFGGSVIEGESSLTRVVHEVYRWRRDGWRVVAVVSARGGDTDALLGECRDINDAADPHAVAGMLSIGEVTSAYRLGLHLDRAGVPAHVANAASIGLVADGDALDATPVALCENALFAALDRDGVVVVPGYAAHDDDGRPVVLGRGGSDLTAIFLARRLEAARCRLVKDVDGLYDRDPRYDGARRYAVAGWQEALDTDGSIVQPKAVEFARHHDVPFELGTFQSLEPTRIGHGPALCGDEEKETPIRVALLGYGTVGRGVHTLLSSMPDRFEVVRIAVRDTRGRPAPFTDDPVAAARCGADVVVEAMGGLEPAATAIESAIASGADVVTANKALLASRGARLEPVLGSAAVGGSMPLLERIAAPGSAAVARVRGVLNGTVNYVLDAVARGASFDDAVDLAREQGFAERDPSRDLDGRDAADKLVVIARAVGVHLDPSGITRETLDGACDGLVRQVATLDVHAAKGRVELVELDRHDPLLVPGVWNVAEIKRADGTTEIVRGRGAGRWPTAEAVVADLLDIARRRRAWAVRATG